MLSKSEKQIRRNDWPFSIMLQALTGNLLSMRCLLKYDGA
jgi:hypothetical protein